jgi:hypothetical protein
VLNIVKKKIKKSPPPTKKKFINGANDTADKRCQQHGRLESPANISLPTPENEK